MSKKRIILTFADAGSSDPNGPDFFQRLRRLLKCSLRSFQLRCVDYRMADDVTDCAPHDAKTMPDMGEIRECSRPSWTKPAENLNRNDSGASELFRAEQGQTGTPAIAATPGKGQR